MHCSIWDTWITQKQFGTRGKKPASRSSVSNRHCEADLFALFWLLLAATSICTILSGPLAGFWTALLLAALGVTLRSRSMVFYSCLILILSFFISFQAEKGQLWIGLEGPEFLEVRSLRDSRPAGEGSLHFFELIRVYDRRGNRAEARGEFLGWSRDRLDLPWGAELLVRSSGIPGRESSGGLVVVEPQDTAAGVPEGFRLRNSWRQGLLYRLNRLPPQASVLMEALLFGSKQRLLSPLEEGFRAIGCSHLLALSGMHLAVIMAVGAGLFGLILRKRVARFLVLLILPWYLFLVGPSPALLRAGIMFSCTVLIPRSTRRIRTRELLLQSFVFLLLIKPDYLFDRGFQYSYAALAGMISLTPLVLKFVARILPYSIAAGFSSGVSAYLGSLPVSLLAYGTTNPVGIIATLILSPLIWLYLAGGILFFLLPGSAMVYQGARLFFWLLYSGIRGIVELFSHVSPCILLPVPAAVLALGAGLVITVQLIYSCLRFTMPEPDGREAWSE
ncbi:ComEC/Rec2 family competence protein [Marispirochaeta aestuarii]|uniref:ComEC/Rec2 family competence protein n=1 Tax=Marispirochaeta aestuarii TaxID=1963862 RepID=UPI002ABD8E4C|nr:ComEC/Rec2 family competence protein [Marispirochaeta aestuarii]